MNNDLNQIIPQRRSRRFSISAFYAAMLATALIGLTFSSQAKTRIAKQSGAAARRTSSSSTLTQTAQQRVAELSKKFAITSMLTLPQGAIAASLVPGATQPTLAFPNTNQSPTRASDTNATSATSSVEQAVTIQPRAIMQTPSGYIATAPLNGLAAGSYVIVHSDGTVAANSAEGNALWSHASFDFTRWTGRYPTVKTGYETPSTPVVALGLDPIDPYQPAGEHPFTVGDLTGDGVDDVAVAHFFAAVIAMDG